MEVFNILQLSCGFAAIEAGGALQHMDWFESGPKLGSIWRSEAFNSLKAVECGGVW